MLGAIETGDIANAGLGKGDYHDVINVILDTTGAVGLTLTVLAAIASAAVVHRIIFSIEDGRNRSLAALSHGSHGSDLRERHARRRKIPCKSLQPVMWMHIGAIYCLLQYDRRHRAKQAPDEEPLSSSGAARTRERQVAFAN